MTKYQANLAYKIFYRAIAQRRRVLNKNQPNRRTPQRTVQARRHELLRRWRVHRKEEGCVGA